MPKMITETIEIYNAATGEIAYETIQTEVMTEEELISQKQDELIRIYSELQALIASATQSQI